MSANSNNKKKKKTITGGGRGRGGGRTNTKSGKAKGIIDDDNNDDDDDDDVIFLSEMLHSKKKQQTSSTQHQQSILLLFFFLSSVVAIVSVIWKQQQQHQHQQQQQTHFISSSSSSRTTTATATGKENKKNNKLSELFRIACNKRTKLGIYCDTKFFDIHNNDRSIRTKKESQSIKKGMKILEIPSTVQVTTIDALRDLRVFELIKQNPRHYISKKALPPKAYLAVYIAFELDRVRNNNNSYNNNNNNSYNNNNNNNINKLSKKKKLTPEIEHLHRAYLDYLPTYQDFVSFHPILALKTNTEPDDDKPLLLSSSISISISISLTEHLMKEWLQYFVSEYNALYDASSSSSSLSSDSSSRTMTTATTTTTTTTNTNTTTATTTTLFTLFAERITWEDYITARLIVNTRSFSSNGPITKNDISDEELELYRPYMNDIPYGRRQSSATTTSTTTTTTTTTSSAAAAAATSSTLFYENLRNTTMLRSCMVPLLDSFDHHSNPNVGWQFVPGEKVSSSTSAGSNNNYDTGSSSSSSLLSSFVAYASQDIVNPGTKLYDSYGSTLSDSWIYAQYGFVNKDRSAIGRRVATLLAPYHQLNDIDFFNKDDEIIEESTSSSQLLLLKYLAFEDGYESCISSSSSSSSSDNIHQQQQQHQLRIEFQQTKFNALKAISNNLKSWFASVPTTATITDDDDDNDVIIPEYLDDGIVDVLSLCRMLAATHRDYNGRAIQYLIEVINTNSGDGDIHLLFPVSKDEHTTDALEYRTWHTLERLATSMAVEIDLRRKILLQQQQRRNGVSDDELSFVLFGELEALSILREHAKRWKQRLLGIATENNAVINEEDYIIRDKPCSVPK